MKNWKAWFLIAAVTLGIVAVDFAQWINAQGPPDRYGNHDGSLGKMLETSRDAGSD